MDEGYYMRRAMHVMEGLGAQESSFYDHPYFGQLFLAGILRLVGYPQILHPSSDLHSIESLYLVPRALMGILSVIDTFLIYKISERMYNSRNVALFGSILFAVMPVTWFTRMILLDSLLLPFLLFSILLALYTTTNSKNKKNNYILILLSGILLGLAIFTKIPVVTMIPLVAFLIYRNNKKLKTLAIWFVPVLLIPLLWPAQSMLVDRFDSWTHDLLWQLHRQNAGLPWIVFLLAIIDPVLFVVAFGGLAHSFIRRDYVILLWSLPFIAFLAAVGYTNFFYWIPILPVLCIGAAKLLFDVVERTKKSTQKVLTVAILSSITIFGLGSTTMLIVTNVTSAQLESAAYVTRYLEGSADDPTVISSPVYSWIFKYVFNKDHVLSDYRDLLYSRIKDDDRRILLIDDPRFKLDIGNENNQLLHALYSNTSTIAIFKGNVTNFDLGLYPYTSMVENYEGSEVAIRLSNSHS
jgi:4-amino-4-deoxy-L-arabinose transferase-like glycosyltransferase